MTQLDFDDFFQHLKTSFSPAVFAVSSLVVVVNVVAVLIVDAVVGNRGSAL